MPIVYSIDMCDVYRYGIYLYGYSSYRSYYEWYIYNDFNTFRCWNMSIICINYKCACKFTLSCHCRGSNNIYVVVDLGRSFLVHWKMAVNDSTDAMAALSVNDDLWKELGLNDIIQTQLIKIENDYESIFSWGIQRLTGVSQNLRSNLVDKVRGKQEMITGMDSGKNDEFNLNE